MTDVVTLRHILYKDRQLTVRPLGRSFEILLSLKDQYYTKTWFIQNEKMGWQSRTF
jgi:hypothetical protein